jgi:hypothetical protein
MNERMKDQDCLKLFRNKLCRIVWKDSAEEVRAVLGKVLHLNESYLVEQDDKGLIYFLRFDSLIKIEEVTASSKEDEKSE